MKFDRIGNKLGLAGLIGVLLSGAMVFNQIVAERKIDAANAVAAGQQYINEHTLEANIALRRMQLAVRDIRLAKNIPDVDKAAATLNEMTARISKELAGATQRTIIPENKARLEKISALVKDYETYAAAQVATIKQIFDITAKRNAASSEWGKSLDALRVSPAISGRLEVEKTLLEADTNFNAVRAAAWRFTSTGEEEQRKLADVRSKDVTDALSRLKTLTNDRSLSAAVDQLLASAASFTSLTNEALKNEVIKMEQAASLLSTANQSAGLMREAVDESSKN